MHFHRFLPALLPLLLSPVLPCQEPPSIVSTIPPNHATGVSTRLGRILVVFDKDMLQGAMSLVKAGPGRIPPLKAKPRFLDARTFSIPLGLLKPGTTYSIGFNSARRKGFQSTDNVPLAPYILVFTTKGEKTAPPGEAAPARPAQSLPRVLRTSPPKGSRSVDPALDKVEIWFSHDMNPRSMSLTRLPGRAKLGYIPGRLPYFAGPRRLVIPVRLAPGTEYGVGINTGNRKGFLTKAGVPVAPFELLFTTRGTTAAHKVLLPPAGRWVMKTPTGRIEHWFFPDGKWGLLRVNGKNRAFIHGRWSAKKDELILSDEGGRKLSPLRWALDAGGTLILRRSAADRRPRRYSPLPLPSAAELAGRWRTQWGANNSRTWTFQKDGAFSCSTLVLGQKIDRRGKWEIEGLRLVVRGKETSAPEIYGWCLEPSGKLALTMESGVTQFYEKLGPAAPPRPPAGPIQARGMEGPKPVPAAPKADPLLGRWIALREGMSMEIVLLPGGRYTQKIVSPDGTETTRGTWVNKGSYLVVKEEGDEERTRVEYKFMGPNRIEITIEGEKLLFSRAEKGAPAPPAPAPPRAGARPRALQGTWAAEDPTGALELNLLFDGTFQFYLRQGARETILEGTWTASGGTIHLTIRKPKQGRLEIPYEGPRGDSLPVTLNHTRVVLKKQ